MHENDGIRFFFMYNWLPIIEKLYEHGGSDPSALAFRCGINQFLAA